MTSSTCYTTLAWSLVQTRYACYLLYTRPSDQTTNRFAEMPIQGQYWPGRVLGVEITVCAWAVRCRQFQDTMNDISFGSCHKGLRNILDHQGLLCASPAACGVDYLLTTARRLNVLTAQTKRHRKQQEPSRYAVPTSVLPLSHGEIRIEDWRVHGRSVYCGV